MPVIASISGIRGTIGGKVGDALTPIDVVKYAAAFGTYIVRQLSGGRGKVVIGRDARISGDMVRRLVVATLQGVGLDVLDLDLATTPTVEMAVTAEKAQGGIILSASHNPKHWNALKLLNDKGEFISHEQGHAVLQIAQTGDFQFADINNLGNYTTSDSYLAYHIQKILALDLVDSPAIKKRGFRVLVDAINSVGGIAVPALLRALGVSDIIEINCHPDGNFQHNPEPLPENLNAIANEVRRNNADLALVVDPDVDRLAIICEDGTMFGEEYSLVAIADYVLSKTPGNTVSNMSSSRALRDITNKHNGNYQASAVGEVNVVTLMKYKKGTTVSNLSSTQALRDITQRAGQSYHAAAVGEVNVVSLMKEVGAVVGGEGNGGIIYPALHYGRDALAGIALFLSHLAQFGKSCSALRLRYPNYYLIKNKAELPPEIDLGAVFERLTQKYKNHPQNTNDGLRLDFDRDWIHLRRSNTEPIVRIYAESLTEVTAYAMIKQIQKDIKEYAQA